MPDGKMASGRAIADVPDQDRAPAARRRGALLGAWPVAALGLAGLATLAWIALLVWLAVAGVRRLIGIG